MRSVGRLDLGKLEKFRSDAPRGNQERRVGVLELEVDDAQEGFEGFHVEQATCDKRVLAVDDPRGLLGLRASLRPRILDDDALFGKQVAIALEFAFV